MGNRSMFVGLNVHKETIDVSIAEGHRNGEVRHYGVIASDLEPLDKVVRALRAPNRRLHFVYEAGPCGFGIYRHLTKRGEECVVVSPSMVAALTHWSFEQLATIAGAPPKYLRSLPASIASGAINFGLQRHRRTQHQLFVDRDAPWTVHAITSSRYARVHHDELATRVLDLMAAHPSWSLPLGYKDGVYGAERVPSGAYLGDRDLFLFLVDGNHDLDDPTDSTMPACSAGSWSGTAMLEPPP